MTRTIYANLQLWDPMGQMKLDPGLMYGGQSMLFVLAADDLRAGLLRLVDAVATKGLGLVRVMYAGYTDAFDTDHFPYEVDMGPMIADALDQDKICAVGPFTFDPAAAPESADVMLACIDVFDPSQADEGAYDGALCLAGVAGNVADGLRALIADMQAQEIDLKHIEDAKDGSEHAEVYSFETSVEDMIGKAQNASAPVYSDMIAYDRKS
ncbi:hypothetical protein RXV86_01250 [Alisedimentitalea sp. MJ-SS2]|uniref:hypothetical protein n=1 Tax=Aliisedimentitalea sp. MJ-SS2 TaxID=3049795 RepID=UPI0029119630|nr:hypothetical protein [Alisedimentitalea sp. MJ-SS2]MDU8926001.1 hypothetical protein [Alisedimentitalea sp. MJ-SS2]